MGYEVLKTPIDHIDHSCGNKNGEVSGVCDNPDQKNPLRDRPEPMKGVYVREQSGVNLQPPFRDIYRSIDVERGETRKEDVSDKWSQKDLRVEVEELHGMGSFIKFRF